MAWSQVAMFWATVGLVLVSVFAATTSYFLLRSSLDPHVVVYVKHDERRPSVIVIVIENVGPSLAYTVVCTSDRPVPSKAFGVGPPRRPATAVMTHGPLVDGIPVLGPGDRRVITWGQYHGLSAALNKRPIRVTCQFESRRRFPFDPTSHSTESVLEVESFAATDASSGPEVEVARAVKKIAETFSRFGSGWHQLRVELTNPGSMHITAVNDEPADEDDGGEEGSIQSFESDSEEGGAEGGAV